MSPEPRVAAAVTPGPAPVFTAPLFVCFAEPELELKPFTFGAKPDGRFGVELMSPLSLLIGIILSAELRVLLLLLLLAGAAASSLMGTTRSAVCCWVSAS